MMPAYINVTGFDPSLRHWGIAQGRYCISSRQLEVTHVETIEPVLSTGKQVRASSKDIEAALHLATAVQAAVSQTNAIFVEIPSGSQSYRGGLANGVCFGILGYLRSLGCHFHEMTATEVKRAATGKANATKAQMISWATDKHPEAPWSTYKQKGKLVISESKVEHQADAVATIYAGLQSQAFQQSLLLSTG